MNLLRVPLNSLGSVFLQVLENSPSSWDLSAAGRLPILPGTEEGIPQRGKRGGLLEGLGLGGTSGEHFLFFGITPLHPSVLKPNLHLWIK